MKDTPSMRQYRQIKEQYPDAVLFFRMGDFYETFEDDARVTANVLDITLTSRDKGEDKTPMAGIPYHALMSYLPKMIQAGHKVALCEQIGDPKTTKGIVEREVVKVFTPGTTLESEVLDPKSSVEMISVYLHPKVKQGVIGIAVIDLTAGKFRVYESKDAAQIAEIIQIVQPAEVILPESLIDFVHSNNDAYSRLLQAMEHIPMSFIANYDFQNGKEYLEQHFKTVNLKGFVREDMTISLDAGGALLKYIEQTQKHTVLTLEKIEELSFSQTMRLDPSTIINLELVSSYAKGKKTTLADVLDNTKTAMGARLLRYSVLYPLLDRIEIQKRLEAVSYFSQIDISGVQNLLLRIADIERINARMSFLSASPRDFLSLRDSLDAFLSLSPILSDNKKPSYVHELIDDEHLRKTAEEISGRIRTTISDEATVLVTGGNVINAGINKELDELKDMLKHGRSWIKAFQEKEIARTGINSLKIRYNKVFGYYIEISNAHKTKVPADYIRKQTLVNAERYLTEELKEKEDMILHAQDRIIAIENDIFSAFKEEMLSYLIPLKRISSHIAYIDMLTSFADRALTNGYTKPVIADDPVLKPIRIVAGRHPVIEQNMDAGSYIPNDVYLDCADHQVMLVTGPNMSGKSSILRMTALISLLAQIGSFVPADEAELAIVDRIFSRVGARDNIASGESTFMVEMNETANILHNASSSSLIILDEIGRGTSTYDGVSIAYAVVEYIHEHIGAKTMFATHYHELTDMEHIYKRVKNYNVLVKEDRDTIIFLRKLVRGGTDKSYGIHVAKIAGVPKDVLKRAELVLKQFDAVKESMKKADIPPLLSFISEEHIPESPEVTRESAIISRLKEMDLNSMTPLESMHFLEELLKELDT